MLDGHEFEQAPGVGNGQGNLGCCSSWGLKELDMTEWLNWPDWSALCMYTYIYIYIYRERERVLTKSPLGSCTIPISPHHPWGLPEQTMHIYRTEIFQSQEVNLQHPLSLDISITWPPKVNLCSKFALYFFPLITIYAEDTFMSRMFLGELWISGWAQGGSTESFVPGAGVPLRSLAGSDLDENCQRSWKPISSAFLVLRGQTPRGYHCGKRIPQHLLFQGKV